MDEFDAFVTTSNLRSTTDRTSGHNRICGQRDPGDITEQVFDTERDTPRPARGYRAGMTTPEAEPGRAPRTWQDLPHRVPAEDLVEEITAAAAPELLPDYLRIYYSGGFNGPGAPVG